MHVAACRSKLACDFVQLLIKLGQLCTFAHDVLPHEERRHDRHGAPLIAGVQSILYQRLIQKHSLVSEVEASAACRHAMAACLTISCLGIEQNLSLSAERTVSRPDSEALPHF